MQDFESVALGLTVKKAKTTLVPNEHILLSNAEMQIVSSLPNSAVYNVILRIMEGEIEKLETRHLQLYDDKDKFDRSGLIAVAARVFYENIQKEINHQSSEFFGNKEAEEIEKQTASMTPEEILRKGFGYE